MAGDYNFWQSIFRRKSTDSIAVAATDYSSTAQPLVTPKNSSYTVFVQKIVVSVTTYAAKTWTFQDSAGTPVPVAVCSVPAAAPTTGGDAKFEFDFGPKGIALTEGKSLDWKMSAAGAAGIVHVEAYERLTSAVAVASTN